MKQAHPRAFKTLLSGVVLILILLVTYAGLAFWPASPWTDAEKVLIRSLWLETLPPLPEDPSNAVADSPLAVDMGHALFFDKRLSVNGAFSCASCHRPELNFTDGLDKARALGHSRRNTPSIAGLAYSPWLYWDGRRDSLWAQALSPLEDPEEMGNNRLNIARLIMEDPDYREQYAGLFGEVPDFSNRNRFPDNAGPGSTETWDQAWRLMNEDDRRQVNRVFANVGKAIASYERLMVPGVSRFDEYASAVLNNDADADNLLTATEKKGLRLFIDKGRCMECHNGPLFTNNEFHNTGIISYPGDLPDRGRVDGLRQVRKDPFNCLGAYSDAAQGQCPELVYAREGIELIGAFKTPSLRNLAKTAPYMHKGQIATLTDTIRHYNDSPLAMIGHNEAEDPLGLLPFERKQVEAFLLTLQAPINVAPDLLEPPK